LLVPFVRRATSRLALILEFLVDDNDPAIGLISINAQLPTAQYLAAMWDRREFAIDVPLEQMRSQHRTTLLGSLWHFFNPILAISVYYLVFAVLLKVDRGIDHYLLWLTIGVFTFRLTQNTVQNGATALSGNMGLIRSFRFPRALLPISVVISQLLTFAIELGLLAALATVAGGGISRRWLFLPLVVFVHTALNLGGAFISARLNEAFRDVQQLLPYVFRILIYLSGVMFPIERLLAENLSSASWAAQLVSYNPILRVIDLYRWVFLGTPELDIAVIVRTAGLSALVLWFGFRYFRAAEWRYGRS
jgi:teichoic acid transport system permease protein